MDVQHVNIFQQMLDDKRAIRDCIRNNGSLEQLAHERNLRFAAPL